MMIKKESRTAEGDGGGGKEEIGKERKEVEIIY